MKMTMLHTADEFATRGELFCTKMTERLLPPRGSFPNAKPSRIDVSVLFGRRKSLSD